MLIFHFILKTGTILDLILAKLIFIFVTTATAVVRQPTIATKYSTTVNTTATTLAKIWPFDP